MGVPTATYFRTAQLVPLFQRMLERCKLTEDETILVVSDPDSNQEYVAAMFAAARSFGADAMSLMLPPPPPEQAVFIRTGNISSTIRGAGYEHDVVRLAEEIFAWIPGARTSVGKTLIPSWDF